MPRKPKPDPVKSCSRCGVQLARKRYGKNLEDMTRFLLRAYCSLRCANSRGVRSLSSTSQHKLSAVFVKPACETCGDGPTEELPLHVHHINEDWTDHRLENLQTLCIRCHLRLHNTKKDRPPCSHCESPAMKRGMCQKHYQRWRKYGDARLTKRREPGTPNGNWLTCDP